MQKSCCHFYINSERSKAIMVLITATYLFDFHIPFRIIRGSGLLKPLRWMRQKLLEISLRLLTLFSLRIIQGCPSPHPYPSSLTQGRIRSSLNSQTFSGSGSVLPDVQSMKFPFSELQYGGS